MGDEGEAVKVAVRVRKFNQREIDAGATRIVRMQNFDQGSKTYLTNPETKEEKDFAYDFSFQSHSKDEQGIGEWATQDTVFDTLGAPVLTNVQSGCNVCLFAYGQTGAGKSYSMLGKPDDQGIVPRTCNALFKLKDGNKNPRITYNIEIQVVEVYMDQVNNLLMDRSKWPAKGFEPQYTKDGYIVKTDPWVCEAYEDIEKAITFADKNRSIGSHALNPESSRAHTIYIIAYTQVEKDEKDKVLKTVNSRLNLVDLAGSERTETAGTSGQMLAEGNAINKSLTSLGNCIKSLSEGKAPNYRDSKLT
eukprot:RCo031951